MDKVKYKVIWTTKFKKDYKLAERRNLKMELLDDVIAMLAKGQALPEKYRDHELTGNWTGYRECHIKPDWLLVYYIVDDVLTLTLSRTGTHSDLFKQ
ncbi:MAG: type II toxin-antitoxin system YafQ family toxin [Firmicutes bacterium]|nr:type II toxin-antitoxin system YafQ family toxin [Bacillota bacterium]